MPICHYWIVTYHPNPIREDRVSIGVIASDDLTVECRFVHTPEVLPNTTSTPAPPYNQIEHYRAHLNNIYQLTAPRIASSVSGVDEAVEDLYRAFVSPE